MSNLIGDLLQLSRIGRTLNTVVDADVNDVVRSVVERYSATCKEMNATVEVQPDMPHVVADRMRLTQLFENLIGNALKYGCDAPDPRITIGWESGQGDVRFFVRDNGDGIPNEFHEKMFGLFQRLDNDQGGTGVGLAIVLRIAQAHGGRVWGESAPGAGATFWVELPTS